MNGITCLVNTIITGTIYSELHYLQTLVGMIVQIVMRSRRGR